MKEFQKPPVVAASQSVAYGVSQEDRTYTMLLHLSPLLGFLIPIPAANIVCPLVLWLIKKDESEFIDEQGKEAINFQITMTIALVVAALLCFVFIGIVLVPAVLVVQTVFMILAAIASKDGKPYRYPLTIRFIS